MIFTDSMIRAVKQATIEGFYDGLTTEEMIALLARLEAAEEAFEAANEWIAANGAMEQNQIYIAKYEAWCKSAGKD